MKNLKKGVIALSLLVVLGLGSLVYASDFNTSPEPTDTDRYEEINEYGHCHERGSHHRHHRHHNMRNRIN